MAPVLASSNNFEVSDNTNLTNKTEDILVLYDARQDENGKTNTEILQDFIQNVPSGGPISIQLKGRTLYRDGTWNTICLPFTLEFEAFTGSIFEGATVMSFDASDFDPLDGELTLTFQKGLDVIVAGYPLFVKWVDKKSDITDSIFSNVKIKEVSPYDPFASDYADFIGTFDNLTFDEERKDILYLGAENKLFYPSPEVDESVTIGVFRGYFELHLPEDQQARTFLLNFGDEETGISDIHLSDPSNSSNLSNPSTPSWYTLDGRRLSGKPTTSGLYISNGRKVIIK